MLVRVLLAAILAGVAAGVFATGAQALRVTPLILEAETYENAGSHGHHHDSAVADHHHDGAVAEDGGEWAPADGFERRFYTLMANIVVAVGFALVVTAAVLVTGQGISLATGLVWGLAGFVVFVLAPNFGLPPELPGMVAAPLGERQAWWLASVIATSGALAIFAFRRQPAWIVAGVLLLVAPHVYGAPQPASHETLVPVHLAVEFAVASIATAFAFWLFLGGALGFALERAMRAEAMAVAEAPA